MTPMSVELTIVYCIEEKYMREMDVTRLLTILGLLAMWSDGQSAGPTAGDRCPSPNMTSPDGTHCPVYYTCGHTGHQIWMKRFCVYPLVFSLSSHTCEGYEEVDCGPRGVSFTPCEYQPQCKPQQPDTCFCKKHFYFGDVDWAFCIGKTTGNYPYNTRPTTDYYIHCKDNRTIPSSCREGLTFDPSQMVCREDTSTSPSMVVTCDSGSGYMTSFPDTNNSPFSSQNGQLTETVTNNHNGISSVFEGSQYILTNQISQSILQTTITELSESDHRIEASPNERHSMTPVTSLNYQSYVLSTSGMTNTYHIPETLIGNPLTTSLNVDFHESHLKDFYTDPIIDTTTLSQTSSHTLDYTTTISASNAFPNTNEIKTTLTSVHHNLKEISVNSERETPSSGNRALEVFSTMVESSGGSLTSKDIDKTLKPPEASSSEMSNTDPLPLTTFVDGAVTSSSSFTENLRVLSPSMPQFELFASVVARTAIESDSIEEIVIMSDRHVPSSIESESEQTVTMSDLHVPSSIESDSIEPTVVMSDRQVPSSMETYSVEQTVIMSDRQVPSSVESDSVEQTVIMSDRHVPSSMETYSELPVMSQPIKPLSASSHVITTSVVSDLEMSTWKISQFIMPTTDTSASVDETAAISGSITSTMSEYIIPKSKVSDFEMSSVEDGSDVPIAKVSNSVRSNTVITDSETLTRKPYSEITTSTAAREFTAATVSKSTKMFSSSQAESSLQKEILTDSEMPTATNLPVTGSAGSSGVETEALVKSSDVAPSSPPMATHLTSASIGAIKSLRTSSQQDTESVKTYLSSAIPSSSYSRIKGENLTWSQSIQSTPSVNSNVQQPNSSEIVQFVTSNNQETDLPLESHITNTDKGPFIASETFQPLTSNHLNSELTLGNNINVNSLKTRQIMDVTPLSQTQCTYSNIRPSKSSENHQPSDIMVEVTTNGPTPIPTTHQTTEHTGQHSITSNNVSVVVAGVAGGVVLALTLTLMTLIIRSLRRKKESLTITKIDDVQGDTHVNWLLNQKEADLIY